jgi:hypothetical protein
MDATPNHSGAPLLIPSSGAHHNNNNTTVPQTLQSTDFTAIPQTLQSTGFTALPQTRQSTDLTAIPQTHNSTNTADMVFFTFTTGKNYYGYEEGVNAANLTSKDIKAANARLAPMRNRRIEEGLLKATRDDPGYVSPKPAATKGFCDYAKWTKAEMLKAMIARGIKTKSSRLGDM